MPQFPHTSHGLQPAKDLFHPLALLLADRITTVPRRTPIDGTLAPFVVLHHVRRHLHVAGLGYELLEYVYGLAAVSPQDGKFSALVLSWVDAEAMT